MGQMGTATRQSRMALSWFISFCNLLIYMNLRKVRPPVKMVLFYDTSQTGGHGWPILLTPCARSMPTSASVQHTPPTILLKCEISTPHPSPQSPFPQPRLPTSPTKIVDHTQRQNMPAFGPLHSAEIARKSAHQTRQSGAGAPPQRV